MTDATAVRTPLSNGAEIDEREVFDHVKSRGFLAAGLLQANGVKPDVRLQAFVQNRRGFLTSKMSDGWSLGINNIPEGYIFPMYLSADGLPLISTPVEFRNPDYTREVWVYSEIPSDDRSLREKFSIAAARSLIDAYNKIIEQQRA